jgi:hypothetical protein
MNRDAEIARVTGGEARASKTFSAGGWKLRLTASGEKPRLRGRADWASSARRWSGFAGYKTLFVGEWRTEVDGRRARDDDVRLSNALRDKARKRYESAGCRLWSASCAPVRSSPARTFAVALWGPKGPVAGRPGVAHLRRDRHPGTRGCLSASPRASRRCG